MKILVTGATGTLGRAVVKAAAAAGHEVRAMSRKRERTGPTGPSERMGPTPSERIGPTESAATTETVTADLSNGKGLVAAVEGVQAIVHAATDPRRSDSVDVDGTRLLLDVARRARVSHFLYISIVGVDKIPLGYYRAKLRAEELVETSTMPYSILRATQFHGFIDALLSKAANLLPWVMPLPSSFHVQSVDVHDVASRIVTSLADGPKQRLRDFGGPDTMLLADAAAYWKQARGVTKRIISIPIPGGTAAGFRAGANIAWNGDLGTTRWTEWLERHRTPQETAR